jgi:GNAT superfamily N-acetyltransferase
MGGRSLTVPCTIRPAAGPADIAAARGLFLAYAAGLGIDLSFQGFDTELASLPGAYAPPEGAILLATDRDGHAAGCVALRALPAIPGGCEMKRLFVHPSARGHGLGERLVAAVLDVARGAGYRRMMLDSLDTMAGALRLYRAACFAPVRPYNDGALPGMVWMGRDL